MREIIEKLNKKIIEVDGLSNWQQRNYFWFLCDKKKNNKLTEKESEDFYFLNKKFII